jgi:cell wall-associated NlpC family hydrolase
MKKLITCVFLCTSLLFAGLFGGENTEAASYGSSAAVMAKKYIGVPYKWGGTSPKGFDCSGLIGYSYSKAGKKIPRTTGQLYKTGQAVQKKSLKKGDVVFFSTYKKGPSHVGLYLGGNQFIHASSSKGVKIDSMSNPYWSKAYYGAKRI